MKRLAFSYTTHIAFEVPVTEHYFTLRCLPAETPRQHLLTGTLTLRPETGWTMQRDGFGNLLQVGCIRTPHECFAYHAEGEILVDHSQPDPSPCNPAFLYPSPLTVPGPEIRALYEARGRGKTPEALMELVHDTIAYVPGSTHVGTAAEEALAQRQGVCQDMAQLLCALCRLNGVPARYACGLFVGEGATHAWTEVYENGVWRGLDPTRNQPVDEEYIVLGCGRDYGDCPIERGVFRGSTAQTQTIFMQVKDAE